MRVIEELCRKTGAAEKDKARDPQYFQATYGVRQVGSESPNVFNL